MRLVHGRAHLLQAWENYRASSVGALTCTGEKSNVYKSDVQKRCMCIQ